MKTPAVFVLLLACCVSADPLVDVVAKLSADVTALQSLTQEQAAKLEGQQTEIEKLKEGKQVAFSASLVVTGHQSFGPFKENTPLVFKHVVTNIGNAYSPVTGNFTAPLKGAYHFEWHLYGHGGEYATSGILFKNSENIFLAYEIQPSGAVSASQGASLLLEAGDVVSVRQTAGSTVFDCHNHHTTFSGHLLFTL